MLYYYLFYTILYSCFESSALGLPLDDRQHDQLHVPSNGQNTTGDGSQVTFTGQKRELRQAAKEPQDVCIYYIDPKFEEPSVCDLAGEKLDLCPRGQYKGCYCAKDRSDFCESCEEGKTYMDDINNCTKCKICSECGVDEEIDRDCTRYDNTVCKPKTNTTDTPAPPPGSKSPSTDRPSTSTTASNITLVTTFLSTSKSTSTAEFYTNSTKPEPGKLSTPAISSNLIITIGIIIVLVIIIVGFMVCLYFKKRQVDNLKKELDDIRRPSGNDSDRCHDSQDGGDQDNDQNDGSQNDNGQSNNGNSMESASNNGIVTSDNGVPAKSDQNNTEQTYVPSKQQVKNGKYAPLNKQERPSRSEPSSVPERVEDNNQRDQSSPSNKNNKGQPAGDIEMKNLLKETASGDDSLLCEQRHVNTAFDKSMTSGPVPADAAAGPSDMEIDTDTHEDDSYLDILPEDLHFQQVIDELEPTDFVNFYVALHIEAKDYEKDIENAGQDVSLQALNVLRSWRKKISRKATLRLIIDALENRRLNLPRDNLINKWKPDGDKKPVI